MRWFGTFSFYMTLSSIRLNILLSRLGFSGGYPDSITELTLTLGITLREQRGRGAQFSRGSIRHRLPGQCGGGSPAVPTTPAHRTNKKTDTAHSPTPPTPHGSLLATMAYSDVARMAGLKLFEKHLKQYEPVDPLYETYTDNKGRQKRRKVRRIPATIGSFHLPYHQTDWKFIVASVKSLLVYQNGTRASSNPSRGALITSTPVSISAVSDSDGRS